MEYGVVYQARNLINGKRYIGKTMYALEKRMRDHLFSAAKNPKTYFHKALAHYGAAAFSWSIIYSSEFDSALCEMERQFIKYFECREPNGYNLCDGGEGPSGIKRTPEQRKAHGDRVRGRRATPETKAKISAALMGRRASEKQKTASRNRLTGNKIWLGRNHTAETRAKMRASNAGTNLGRKASAETRAKQSVARQGMAVSQATREKLRQNGLGRKHTVESIEKMRLSRIGKRPSPEATAKRLAKLIGFKHRPESIEKMRAAYRLRKKENGRFVK
jgi:group I intron endonuclease